MRLGKIALLVAIDLVEVLLVASIVDRPHVAERLAEPAVVAARAAQPDELRGHRIERREPGDRGQHLFQHRPQLGVGGCQSDTERIRCEELAEHRPHAELEVDRVDALHERRRGVAERGGDVRSLLIGDRCDIEHELLDE